MRAAILRLLLPVPGAAHLHYMRGFAQRCADSHGPQMGQRPVGQSPWTQIAYPERERAPNADDATNPH